MLGSCPAPSSALLQPFSSKVHYLLSGSFNSVFLYLLAFNPSTSSLSLHSKINGEGPHQFLALNHQRDRAYATTWALPASLSAWKVVGGGRDGLEKINTVPITATSSYIQVSPDGSRIYSAGGPTGEVHDVDPWTGGFGAKLQEMLYVPADELEKADKTRVALRYGSHSVDLSMRKQAFVPHLGHNSIFMYNVKEDGTLDLLVDCPSFGEHDGPRHVVPSTDGSKLYAVTEHNSYVDVYQVNSDSLSHLQRLSVIPPDKESTRLSYRGDTLRLSQDGQYLYVTTRGKTSATRGYVSVWRVAADGTLGDDSNVPYDDPYAPLTRWETPTSGGKANAIDTFPFHAKDSPVTKDWIVLTDDEEGTGWIWILEWDGKRMEEIAALRLVEEGEDGKTVAVGSSHAVWLS